MKEKVINNKKILKKTHFEALSFLFQNLNRLFSSLLGFSILAYITGWLNAKSYFSTFGASWILSDISSISILSFSWYPLSIIVWIFYLGFLDIIESENRWKLSHLILKYGLIVLAVSFISIEILGYFKLLTLSNILSIVLGISYLLYAGAAFEALIVKLKDNNLSWDVSTIYLIFAILIFGFYSVPTSLGIQSAKIDIDIEKSSLPIVQIRNDLQKDYRLLYYNHNKFYLIKLDSVEKYPNIFIKDQEQIKYIRKYK